MVQLTSVIQLCPSPGKSMFPQACNSAGLYLCHLVEGGRNDAGPLGDMDEFPFWNLISTIK